MSKVAGVLTDMTIARDGNCKNRKVLLEAFPDDDANNLVCPIKLLLIQAIRLGYVPELEVIDTVNSSPSKVKQISWAPQAIDRPVIPAFRSAGMGVDPEKPAGTNQANENLRGC